MVRSPFKLKAVLLFRLAWQNKLALRLFGSFFFFQGSHDRVIVYISRETKKTKYKIPQKICRGKIYVGEESADLKADY